MTNDLPTIELRDAETGALIGEWQLPRDMWRDLQAVAHASGMSEEQIISVALERFLAGWSNRES